MISIKLQKLYWNHTSTWVFSCKFAAYFRNTFSYEHLWMAASGVLKEYNLVVIWRIRNATSNRFTFRQNHSSGFVQKNLIRFFFAWNSFLESTQEADTLPSFCSDHLPVLFIYKSCSSFDLEKKVWKFNSTLTHDETYITQMKEYISLIRNGINDNFAENSNAK